MVKGGLQAKLVEIKVENAKGKMELKEAISRSAKQDTLLQSLSCRLAATEQGVDSARAEAVKAFKDSQAFTNAIAECSIDSYQLGFADCKEATAKLFPGLDLSKVNPPGSDEDEEEEVAGQQVDVSTPVDTSAETMEENATREP